MTWEQIQLFAEKAGERIAQDLLTGVANQTTAIGVALTGDAEPLKQMARQFGLPYDRRMAPPREDDQFGRVISKFAEAGHVRIQSGTDGRRAKRPARSQDKRVPLATPKGRGADR